MQNKFMRNTVLAVMAGVFLLTGSSVLWARGEAVKFADFSWESVQLHNRIAGFIIEKGFGKPVEYLFVESLPGLMGIERGDIQLSMEGWVDNVPEFWAKAQEKGDMISLGKNFPDSPQGWYVPTFVIKETPNGGLSPWRRISVPWRDLARYAHLFADPEDPEKGRFLNGPTGRNVSSKNVQRLKAYDWMPIITTCSPDLPALSLRGSPGPTKQG